MCHLAAVSDKQVTWKLCNKVTVSGKVKTDFLLVREERNVLSADPGGRAIQGVGLGPLASWHCEFESYRGHGWMLCVCVLCGVR